MEGDQSDLLEVIECHHIPGTGVLILKIYSKDIMGLLSKA